MHVWVDSLNNMKLYSPVFFFSHQKKYTPTTFLELNIQSERNITLRLKLTPGHFLFRNNSLVQARFLQLGDTVSSGIVRAIRSVLDIGLFNPHTVNGAIVVDGTRCSCYTEEIHPMLGNFFLAPIRAMFSYLK
jgi:hypothetical protein